MKWRNTRILAAVAAAVALGGAGAPNNQTAQTAQPTPAQQAASASSLLEMYGQAQADSPGVKAAQAGVDAAQYGVHDAYFGYLPRATMVYNPQQEFQRVFNTDNPVYQVGRRYFGNTGFSFQVLQPIIDFPAMARIQGAYAERRNQTAQLTAIRQKMTYDLIEGYLLALASLDSERLALTEEQTYAKHRDEIQRRMNRGLANRTELADISSRIDRARSDQIVAHAGVTKAMSILQRITGHPVPSLLPLENDIPMGTPVPPNPEAWVESANHANPELKAMAAQADVADAEFKRMIGESLPRLDVILSDEHLNAGGSLYGGGARTEQQIAELRLTVPLFNAEGRGYPAFAGYEKRKQARYATEDRTLDVDQRVRAAFADAQRDAESSASLQSALRNHTIVRDDILRKFTAGVATTGDVIDAERDYVRAQRELLAAHYNYLIAIMQLKRLTGTISEDDVRYLDTLLDRRHAYVAMAAPQR